MLLCRILFREDHRESYGIGLPSNRFMRLPVMAAFYSSAVCSLPRESRAPALLTLTVGGSLVFF